MKLGLNSQSVIALRELADAIPGTMTKVVEDTLQLITTYQSVSGSLGVHRDAFHSMLLHIKKAQESAAETIAELPPMLRNTADKIESYLVHKPLVLTAPSYGADGEEHAYRTVIHFSEEASQYPGVKGFGTDAEAAQTWGTHHFSPWQASLSADQRTSIHAYSGNEIYTELNTAKRAGVPFTPELQKINDDISTALQSANLPEDVTVYRALSENAMRELALYGCQGNIEEGATIQDSAFMSCSLAARNTFTNDRHNKFVLRLAAPAGIHAAYIGKLSQFPDEQELLIDGDHSIYIGSVTRCKRSDITGNPYDTDEITVIDGLLTF